MTIHSNLFLKLLLNFLSENTNFITRTLIFVIDFFKLAADVSLLLNRMNKCTCFICVILNINKNSSSKTHRSNTNLQQYFNIIF